MDERPLLYDVCCCAGGATKGYQMAGFRVIGIDKDPQPRYCGDGFIQMDALEFLDRLLAGEYERPAAIHASPPCQRYTMAQNAAKNAAAHPDLIPPVRDRLRALGLPYLIENVVGAPLENPATVCGLALDVNVKRHRLFETNWLLLTPRCPSHNQDYFVIFGHEVRNRRTGQEAGRKNRLSEGRKAMGIDWMTRAELSEAIPPVYTYMAGLQLMAVVKGDSHDSRCVEPQEAAS